MEINPVKGTHDIIGVEAEEYRQIERVAYEISRTYNYEEIRTPIIEHTPLFLRSVGESSDIVTKEMYTFLDKGDRSVTLRPEMTAGVMRSVVTNKLYATNDLPLRYFYLGPCFRYERPQAGRYRQFHQFGVELIGATSYHHDSEVIALGQRLLFTLGLDNVTIKINSLGDEESRKNYKEALKAYFASHIEHMCEDCKKRFETNPLRILDCKVESDREIIKDAPKMSDYLSLESKNRLNDVIADLKKIGIEVEVDDSLVRGLDYYTGVVFEYHVKTNNGVDVGAIGGGGHYGHLLKEVGGPELEGIGMAMGLERLHYVVSDLVTSQVEQSPYLISGPDVYLMGTTEFIIEENFHLADKLRSHGFNVEMNYEVKSLKSLFKTANKKHAKFSVIVGEDEFTKGVVSIKNMLSEEQTTCKVGETTKVLEDLMRELFEKFVNKMMKVAPKKEEAN